MITRTLVSFILGFTGGWLLGLGMVLLGTLCFVGLVLNILGILEEDW